MDSDTLSELRHQYGCGPVEFAGTEHGLYERHLLFDDVVHPAAAGPRERFEAAAHSVRDILSTSGTWSWARCWHSAFAPEPESPAEPTLGHDGSTNNLTRRYRKLKEVK